jgi:Glycosyltransferase family 92
MALSFFTKKSTPEKFVKSFKIERAGKPCADARDLAVTAIIKDEAEYIREWIEFHRLVGVQQFYLYDNGSSDGIEKMLRDYVDAGVVVLTRWPHFLADAHTQALAYAHALVTFGPMTRWMAFIDADEFLFGTREDNLIRILDDYANLPGLVVYRHFFGTSGHSTAPAGLTIENFTYRLRVPVGKLPETFLGRPPKSIVRPSQIEVVHGAHYFIFDETGLIGYDEQRRPLRRGAIEYHTTERLRVNHYYTRDLETFRRRRRGGSSGTNKPASAAEYERNLRVLDAEPVRDETIARFGPLVREALERPLHVALQSQARGLC